MKIACIFCTIGDTPDYNIVQSLCFVMLNALISYSRFPRRMKLYLLFISGIWGRRKSVKISELSCYHDNVHSGYFRMTLRAFHMLLWNMDRV